MVQIDGSRAQEKREKDVQPRTTELEEEEDEANSAREKETKSNTDHAYKLVGSRMLIIGTRLQDPAEAEKKNKKHNNSAQGRAGARQSNQTT